MYGIINLNTKAMEKIKKNQIGQVIDYASITKSCRQLDPDELMRLLKSDIMIYWSWGVEQPTIDNKNNCRMLRLKVNGHHHKGYVYIFVNGADLFDVYLTNFVGNIKDIGTDIYFDELVNWIDEKIERISEYER